MATPYNRAELEAHAEAIKIAFTEKTTDDVLAAGIAAKVNGMNDQDWDALAPEIKLFVNEYNQAEKEAAEAAAKGGGKKKAPAKKTAKPAGKAAVTAPSTVAEGAIDALDWTAFKAAVTELNNSGILPAKVSPIGKKADVVGRFMTAIESLTGVPLDSVPEGASAFYLQLTTGDVPATEAPNTAPKKTAKASKKTVKKPAASAEALAEAKAAAKAAAAEKKPRSQKSPALEAVAGLAVPFRSGTIGHYLCHFVKDTQKAKNIGVPVDEIVAGMEKLIAASPIAGQHSSVEKRILLLLRCACQTGRTNHNGLFTQIVTGKEEAQVVKFAYTGPNLEPLG